MIRTKKSKKLNTQQIENDKTIDLAAQQIAEIFMAHINEEHTKSKDSLNKNFDGNA